MTKSRAALIVLTAPKEADMSEYWDYFFTKPMPRSRTHHQIEQNDYEIRMAALAYLEHRLEKISD